MELTDDIIDMTYKFAFAFLRRSGRRNVDPDDLAHDALVKLAKAAPVEANYLRHRVWLDIKSVFFEFHTNANTRKHDIFRDTKNLVHAEFDMKTTDVDTISAIDEFSKAFEIVYTGNETLAEIVRMMLNGMTVPDIAKNRGTSTQAVYELQKKARTAFATALGITAEIAA
jgi:hypothetical protein